MMIERLDEKAVQKVSGATWGALREEFFSLSRILLAVSSNASSQLTTIYVKFCTTNSFNVVFAVVWIKTSKQMVIGLSLPEDFEDPRLGPPPKGHSYKGLTKFFNVSTEMPLPDDVATWVKIAYENAASNANGN